jgi:transcription elongation GreA/GreB family factor
VLYLCALWLKNMTLKQKIHQQYLQLVQDKIDVFKDMISGLTEDSKNDAKGSAGDKHETALSMMHIEQEKITNKLKEALEQKAILDKIDATVITSKVTVGSLVVTNNLTVYVSVALPKIFIENQNVFAISPQSPLGIQLLGGKVEHEFEMNTVKYQIIAIH